MKKKIKPKVKRIILDTRKKINPKRKVKREVKRINLDSVDSMGRVTLEGIDSNGMPYKRGTGGEAHLKKMWGNEWWKLASKHGRDKLFATPGLMLEAAIEYFKYCDDHPDGRAELVKYEGMAETVAVPLRNPYTMYGLCRYLNANTEYFRYFKASLREKGEENLSEINKEFIRVVNVIEETVQEQQMKGAITGHFNANIIARLLGLVDKKDIIVGAAPIPPVVNVYNIAPPLAGSEEEVVI